MEVGCPKVIPRSPSAAGVFAIMAAGAINETEMNRKGDEQPGIRFRSERFFLSQGQWFCTTREGPILGPFASRDAAVSALERYLIELGIRPDGIWDRPGVSN